MTDPAKDSVVNVTVRLQAAIGKLGRNKSVNVEALRAVFNDELCSAHQRLALKSISSKDFFRAVFAVCETTAADVSAVAARRLATWLGRVVHFFVSDEVPRFHATVEDVACGIGSLFKAKTWVQLKYQPVITLTIAGALGETAVLFLSEFVGVVAMIESAFRISKSEASVFLRDSIRSHAGLFFGADPAWLVERFVRDAVPDEIVPKKKTKRAARSLRQPSLETQSKSTDLVWKLLAGPYGFAFFDQSLLVTEPIQGFVAASRETAGLVSWSTAAQLLPTFYGPIDAVSLATFCKSKSEPFCSAKAFESGTIKLSSVFLQHFNCAAVRSSTRDIPRCRLTTKVCASLDLTISEDTMMRILHDHQIQTAQLITNGAALGDFLSFRALALPLLQSCAKPVATEIRAIIASQLHNALSSGMHDCAFPGAMVVKALLAVFPVLMSPFMTFATSTLALEVNAAFFPSCWGPVTPSSSDISCVIALISLLAEKLSLVCRPTDLCASSFDLHTAVCQVFYCLDNTVADEQSLVADVGSFVLAHLKVLRRYNSRRAFDSRIQLSFGEVVLLLVTLRRHLSPIVDEFRMAREREEVSADDLEKTLGLIARGCLFVDVRRLAFFLKSEIRVNSSRLDWYRTIAGFFSRLRAEHRSPTYAAPPDINIAQSSRAAICVSQWRAVEDDFFSRWDCVQPDGGEGLWPTSGGYVSLLWAVDARETTIAACLADFVQRNGESLPAPALKLLRVPRKIEEMFGLVTECALTRMLSETLDPSRLNADFICSLAAMIFCTTDDEILEGVRRMVAAKLKLDEPMKDGTVGRTASRCTLHEPISPFFRGVASAYPALSAEESLADIATLSAAAFADAVSTRLLPTGADCNATDVVALLRGCVCDFRELRPLDVDLAVLPRQHFYEVGDVPRSYPLAVARRAWQLLSSFLCNLGAVFSLSKIVRTLSDVMVSPQPPHANHARQSTEADDEGADFSRRRQEKAVESFVRHFLSTSGGLTEELLSHSQVVRCFGMFYLSVARQQSAISKLSEVTVNHLITLTNDVWISADVFAHCVVPLAETSVVTGVNPFAHGSLALRFDIDTVLCRTAILYSDYCRNI